VRAVPEGATRSPAAASSAAGARERITGIEGLRGIAAYSILLFHIWIFTSPAKFEWNLGPVTPFMLPLQAGVTLFFVLSGFLLYLPFAVAIAENRPTPSIRRYFRNRFLRIFPAYWVILAVSGLVLGSTIEQWRGPHVVGALGDPLLFLKNAALVAYYDVDTIWTGILPSWSLTIELVFYAVLPLCVALAALAAAGGGSSRRPGLALMAPVALLFILSLLGKLAAVVLVPGPGRSNVSDWHTVLDRSFVTHSDLFAVGMTVAALVALSRHGFLAMPSWLRGPAGARLLLHFGLPFTVLGYYFVHAYVYDTIVACTCGLLLARVVVSRPEASRLLSFLNSRVLFFLGTISYSVFLWNYPLLTFLASHGVLMPPGGPINMLVNVAIAGSATTLAAALTYRFVEAPALRLKTNARVHPGLVGTGFGRLMGGPLGLWRRRPLLGSRSTS
jgi:peptidoglycan/LPS O-acetylase OafA/YrhL